MKKFILLFLLLISSCGSTAERKYYIKDVAAEDRRWWWCVTSKDGPEFDGKGICYSTLKCYKGFLNIEHCETDRLFCAFGDLECVKSNMWPTVIKF